MISSTNNTKYKTTAPKKEDSKYISLINKRTNFNNEFEFASDKYFYNYSKYSNLKDGLSVEGQDLQIFNPTKVKWSFQNVLQTSQ